MAFTSPVFDLRGGLSQATPTFSVFPLPGFEPPALAWAPPAVVFSGLLSSSGLSTDRSHLGPRPRAATPTAACPAPHRSASLQAPYRGFPARCLPTAFTAGTPHGLSQTCGGYLSGRPLPPPPKRWGPFPSWAFAPPSRLCLSGCPCRPRHGSAHGLRPRSLLAHSEAGPSASSPRKGRRPLSQTTRRPGVFGLPSDSPFRERRSASAWRPFQRCKPSGRFRTALQGVPR